MIKSIIIVALLALVGYSYVTNMSVRQIVKQHNVTFQSPIQVKKGVKI